MTLADIDRLIADTADEIERLDGLVENAKGRVRAKLEDLAALRRVREMALELVATAAAGEQEPGA